ncbi:unnamed protein product [Prorocentrum cordatum]|uniref:30S ribosomal protein S1 n=1 Tax=Prorocentrum cordatum TaxID=2364126 RepID=A0ABN9SS40_9DINO|nr:unnamed protein product [Polarella glacialis]
MGVCQDVLEVRHAHPGRRPTDKSEQQTRSQRWRATYQYRTKKVKDAREELQLLEAQRAMAATAAAQEASAQSDISELVYAALRTKIPTGGPMPATFQQQVQTLAATFNEMQHQHEAAVAQQSAQLGATTAASSAAAGAQPKAPPLQAPPMFAAPPAAIQMPPAGAADQPVDVDQDDENDAMDFAGFGCGGKRTPSQLQGTATLMDANGDAETANNVKDAVAAMSAATASFNANYEKVNGVAILVRDHLGFGVGKPKSQSILDYFLASDPLAEKIDKVQTWAKYPPAPRRPVCADFGGGDSFMIPVLAKPQKLPSSAPVGPQVTHQIAGPHGPPDEFHAIHDLKARLQTVTQWCELLLADIAAGVALEGATDQQNRHLDLLMFIVDLPMKAHTQMLASTPELRKGIKKQFRERAGAMLDMVGPGPGFETAALMGQAPAQTRFSNLQCPSSFSIDRALGLLAPVAAAAAAWQGWPAAWATPPRPTGRAARRQRAPRTPRGGAGVAAAGRGGLGLLDLDGQGARTIEDVEVGDVMQGTVVGKGAHAILRLDVGLRGGNAFLVGVPDDLRKVRVGDELRDLRVEYVNTRWNEVDLSFPGLSNLAAGRELRPRESFTPGDLVDGQVTEHLDREIIIDIGSRSMAYMRVPSRLRFLKWLEVGETLRGLTVEVVNDQTGMIQVMLPLHELHDVVAGRAASLTDIREGDILDGTVTHWNRKGLFLDVGCFFEALLQADRDQMFRLKAGDQLQGLKVRRVDMQSTRLSWYSQACGSSWLGAGGCSLMYSGTRSWTAPWCFALR